MSTTQTKKNQFEKQVTPSTLPIKITKVNNTSTMPSTEHENFRKNNGTMATAIRNKKKKNNKKKNEPATKYYNCDYLVVGAGTVGMSFVDTVLSENTSATIIIVDKNSAPGGHWTKAYPFVKLHQPSCFYGVNSLPLGKHLDSKGNEIYDIEDRATGAEILEYYQRVLQKFEDTGRVRFFFGASHCFDETSGMHTIVRQNEADPSIVNCRKVVTVGTDVTVPSMRKPLVPVEKSVNFVPLNEIPSSIASGKYNNYFVFGNGKTGIDAVCELLDRGVDQSQITWILGREAWYVLLESIGDLHENFPSIAKKMLSANSVKECFLAYEECGVVVRLDPTGVFPPVFRGASVTAEEVKKIRSIENVVRMGKATSIEANRIILEKGSLDFTLESTLLVDCMLDNMHGYASFGDDFTIFEKGRINLGPQLGFFNISLSAAVVAFLECSYDDDDDDDADSKKNDCCYFLKGDHIGIPEYMIGSMYMEVKYTEALMKIPGGTKFLFSSRTNMNAPMHHKNGILKMLWGGFGPQQMYKFPKKIAKKVESMGYTDIDHCFGETPKQQPAKLLPKHPSSSKGLRNFFRSKRRISIS